MGYRDWIAHRLHLVRRRVLALSAVKRMRERRYQLFAELLDIQPHESILDVGCSGGDALAAFNQANRITGLDLREANRERFLARPNTVAYVVGDAKTMPFRDREFDVAFSNSLIEHVPVASREQVAREIRRVADRYFVQTPNRWFPIEPHYMLPLFQFLPRRLRHYYDRRFHDEQIDLLTPRELRGLFPDAAIHGERVFGLTKSLLAVRR